MKPGGRVDGDLPWGWWLRAIGGVLQDDKGARWDSVRDAFWRGELGFPPASFAPEQHELLLRTLSSIHSRSVVGAERTTDLFDQNFLFWRFYMCWLGSIGLTAASGRSNALDAPLTDEGRSVLLMLQATREPEWEDLPMAEVVEAVVAAGNGAADDARERALREFEGRVGRRRHLFARERVGRSHLVTLTGVGTRARMPTLRVMWSMSFTDERARDDMFGWLAQRVDRWDNWGRMAYGHGANALTSHLLALVVAGGGLS